MLPHLSENWLVDWDLPNTMGNSMPPRDPTEEDDEEDDETDEPAIIREPDEDE